MEFLFSHTTPTCHGVKTSEKEAKVSHIINMSRTTVVKFTFLFPPYSPPGSTEALDRYRYQTPSAPQLHRHIEGKFTWGVYSSLHWKYKRCSSENYLQQAIFQLFLKYHRYVHTYFSHSVQYFYINKICWLPVNSTNIFGAPAKLQKLC